MHTQNQIKLKATTVCLENQGSIDYMTHVRNSSGLELKCLNHSVDVKRLNYVVAKLFAK